MGFEEHTFLRIGSSAINENSFKQTTATWLQALLLLFICSLSLSNTVVFCKAVQNLENYEISSRSRVSTSF
ncbi:hypothetical protein FRX31_004029 [Thalictrum thalictroides]|uniref:Uncharacterized protein n=1 Tax=Thalictrum thalictroides TaxID=46969 RepID=A0A7J6XAA5_THATH|nr:hypothetical protein FRX31_004029 [Thalictrum thalictroides]